MINFHNYQDQSESMQNQNKNDCYEDLKSNEYKTNQKLMSTGQTPRVIRQKKNSLGGDGIA